ncbi:putative lipase [Blastopirellula sp. JC732]|uniref:Lipase n=1 Tax=Blastopirellula sediminis TaxID=2894196 RepID=A0A9X1MJG3_9BACT|nr:alpha/beta fold hydrolase [Blastopirellula sediminis]MCC9607752.1 putative lipase [Blastopirellula sediminis]MCC9627455.1 putative lipase [Blastopirellula sediminis]
MIDSATPTRNEKVALIHGFASTSLLLKRLERQIRAAGFATQRYGYFSLIGDIEAYARRFSETLRKIDEEADVERLHIVAHSLGGLVTRRALQLYRPAHLGRVVFLASPHHGLYAGRFWGGLLNLVQCRAVAQMSDVPDSYVNQLAPPDFEFAAIAATYDHLVPEHSAHLEGCVDYRIYPTMHTALLLRRDVAQDICNYLAQGRFLDATLTKEAI